MAADAGHRFVERDGARWRVGSGAEVEWIDSYTTIDRTITSAIPPVFDAYATVLGPDTRNDQRRRDRALIAVLRRHSAGQPWWLGYLGTGVDDVVFPDASPVTLYAGWPYVLVQAGPAQAAGWRRSAAPWPTRDLPDLMFPADRSWLVSTLWDDDWSCIGGPDALVAGLRNHPDLASRTRPVTVDQDATPPGHQAI